VCCLHSTHAHLTKNMQLYTLQFVPTASLCVRVLDVEIGRHKFCACKSHDQLQVHFFFLIPVLFTVRAQGIVVCARLRRRDRPSQVRVVSGAAADGQSTRTHILQRRLRVGE
jgi:hypothetical protein